MPAWALCGTTSRHLGTGDWRQWVLGHCVPGWQSAEGAWRRTDAESETRYRAAVAAVAQSEGFTTTDDAALLEWLASPEQAQADAEEATVTSLLACGGAWLVLLPLGHLVARRRRRKA